MSLTAIASVLGGLVVLIWSADRFVDGAASLARRFGMPPLLVGMLVIGFGTSAPEMIVSVLAASQGNAGIALGNAFGSNIVNIALILGLTAVLSPIAVKSGVVRRELPILLGVTLLTAYLLSDLDLSRSDAWILLAVFLVFLGWSIFDARRSSQDPLAEDFAVEEAQSEPLAPGRAVFWTVLGLLLLILSSRFLVWGAVEIATALGVSDLVIGLTVIAVGTSLPELASSLAALRRNEHDIAIGNVVGSNIFNTLVVVGVAGLISFAVPPEVLTRDLPVMTGLTVFLVAICIGLRGKGGRINRVEGAALLAAYVAYTGWLILGAAG